MKKKTTDEIIETINSQDITTPSGRAVVSSVTSRAINSDQKAMKDAGNQAIKKSLQANPTPIRTDRNKYITPELMGYIRDALNNPNKKGKKWIYQYVDTVMETAMKDPESKSGQLFSNFIFNKENFLEHLDSLITKADKEDLEYARYLIRKTLYDKQQEVYDNEIDKKMLIINSRRSGKTELLGRLAVKDLLSPNHRVVYINRNSTSAIRQIKDPFMKAFDAQNQISIVKGSVENQELHFSNGSMMLIIGNNNAGDIDKLRGEKASLVILDECGHQRNMRILIREVIKPLMIDYGPDSKLILVGTPPRNKGTYIEECYNNAVERGWKLYHWTFMDNPFIPERNKVIEEVCKENGCDANSAFIRREYFGEMNAYDDDAKWIKKYSVIKANQLPNTFSHAWVGVDWGYEDKAAVVSVVADISTKRAYVVNSWSEAKQGIATISEEIKKQVAYLKDHYNIAREPWVICDNNEKSAVSDLYHVYKIKNVYCAYKYDKDMALDQLNDFLSSNRICLLEGKSDCIIEDCDNTLWKRDEETDKILHEIDDDCWHPNGCMSLLYVSRQFAIDVMNLVDTNKVARSIVNDE